MNGIAVLEYIGLGFIAGVICGVVFGVSVAVGHPAVRTMWEQHQMAKDARKGIRESLRKLNEALDKRKP